MTEPSSPSTSRDTSEPVPTIVNVFTWQLSHTILNCWTAWPIAFGAKATSKVVSSPERSSNSAGRKVKGGSSTDMSSRGAVRPGQSTSETRRNRPGPPMLLQLKRRTDVLPTRQWPQSKVVSIVRDGGGRRACKGTSNRFSSVSTSKLLS